MNNYNLENDEVILYNSEVSRDDIKGKFNLILTSKKMLFCKSSSNKGLFKFKNNKEENIIDIVKLNTIKIYNNKYQIEQKSSNVFIQTTEKNFIIIFNGTLDAMKFVTKITDTLTGTTMSERGTEKVKEAFNKVDDVLGFSTRDTIKGVIENGVTGTIFKGIKKKNK